MRFGCHCNDNTCDGRPVRFYIPIPEKCDELGLPKRIQNPYVTCYGHRPDDENMFMYRKIPTMEEFKAELGLAGN